jgi:hypothetical protein
MKHTFLKEHSRAARTFQKQQNQNQKNIQISNKKQKQKLPNCFLLQIHIFFPLQQ